MLNPLLIVCLISGVDDKAARVLLRPPTQVLIIGTVHLGNPGRDLVNPEIKELLGERRQKEIRDVVDRLKAFRPTKIALESKPDATKLQQHLDEYLADKYTLTADERDQIGLRLAKEANLAKVYGIDFPLDLDFEALFRYAQENGQGDFIQEAMGEFESQMKAKLAAGYLEKHSIREILQDANAPQTDALGHRIYLALMRIGKREHYPGAELVSRWYQRNLHIATNIARLSERPGERILVLIGAGHGKLLRQFLGEMPGFEVVDCLEYLK
jgi:hypothetical protein